MPKPQHVDDKLYDSILLLFLAGFYRTLVFVPLFVRVSCAPQDKTISKWKKKYTITGWFLLYKSFVLYYNKMELLDQNDFW